MSYKTLIFDLDGTLSDPKDGIVRCTNYALKEHGFEEQSDEAISVHIGPPLDLLFGAFTGSDDHKLIASLVAKYRERYAEIGYAENVLYEGIPQLLQDLHSSNKFQLGVCTSKRKDFAIKILERFDLIAHFSFVSGGDIGIAKWQQLDTLLSENTIDENSLMIGDRSVDLTAAHKNKLASAGVLWGYGSREELTVEKPRYLFESTKQISTWANRQ